MALVETCSMSSVDPNDKYRSDVIAWREADRRLRTIKTTALVASVGAMAIGLMPYWLPALYVGSAIIAVSGIAALAPINKAQDLLRGRKIPLKGSYAKSTKTVLSAISDKILAPVLFGTLATAFTVAEYLVVASHNLLAAGLIDTTKNVCAGAAAYSYGRLRKLIKQGYLGKTKVRGIKNASLME